MLEKEVNLVNNELLAKFADAVLYKIEQHTCILFLKMCINYKK